MKGTLAQAVSLAMQEFKKEYGEDAELEEGDEFVTVFDNCILIMSLEDGIIKTKFLEERPYEVNVDIDIYNKIREDR